MGRGLGLSRAEFSEIKAEHGADALAFISSSKCTNEESYLMQKLARAVIGTNNVDNCSRYCQAPATIGLFRTVGYGGDSGSIRDIEKADLVLIVGSNTAESHPVLATRVKRSHKLAARNSSSPTCANTRWRDAPTCSSIPARERTWSGSRPSAAICSTTDSRTTKFLNQWVNGLEEYRKSLEPFTLEFASRTWACR